MSLLGDIWDSINRFESKNDCSAHQYSLYDREDRMREALGSERNRAKTFATTTQSLLHKLPPSSIAKTFDHYLAGDGSNIDLSREELGKSKAIRDIETRNHERFFEKSLKALKGFTALKSHLLNQQPLTSFMTAIKSF